MRNVITDRSKGFTIIGNCHFNDHNLSLKAMGLLSLLISLPDDWDFSMKGIAAICKDGVDSVCAALTELEKSGYVQRTRIRGKSGRLRKIELTIMERSIYDENEPSKKDGDLKKPVVATPKKEEPIPVEPDQDFPVLENTPQINTQEENKQKENTHESITHTVYWQSHFYTYGRLP